MHLSTHLRNMTEFVLWERLIGRMSDWWIAGLLSMFILCASNLGALHYCLVWGFHVLRVVCASYWLTTKQLSLQVRLNALMLLCESRQTSEPLSDQDLALIRFFLLYNLNSQDPAFRQKVETALKKVSFCFLCRIPFVLYG